MQKQNYQFHFVQVIYRDESSLHPPQPKFRYVSLTSGLVDIEFSANM